MLSFDQYDPGRLGLGRDDALERQFWQFLNAPAIVERMVTATDLGHPAVEGIREHLVQNFGDAMNVERNRQRVGHMTRQIMQMHGFELDQTEVKVNSYPFAKAARYRRVGSFVFHVFRNSSNPNDVCVTGRRSVEELPSSHGERWIYWTCVTSKLQAAVALDLRDTDAVTETIRRDGFVRLRLQRAVRRA